MRSIGIICPSRERPQRFRAFAESAMRLAAVPERVNIVLVVDSDDPARAEYRDVAADVPGVLMLQPTERFSVPGLMDWGARQAPCQLIMAGSDDIEARTRAWDEALDAAMWADGLGCIYFNNGDGRDRVEHFAVGVEWLETVGYFMRPEFKHFCADQWVGDMAKAVGRARWLRDVTFEHMHAKYGKAAWDETYKAKRRENWSGADNELMAAMKPRFEADRELVAHRLRGA